MIILYDGTFSGFLTVVFDCYEQQLDPENICSTNLFQHNLLSQIITISTDENKSKRVWKALQQKMSPELDQLPYLAFLSNQPQIEMVLLRFIKTTFSSTVPIEGNYANSDVLTIRKASRLTTREAMRMIQFVRFQKTKDNIFFAAVAPDYDILFMVVKHFMNRFTDQQWIIFDTKRDFGFFYNRSAIQEIQLSERTFGHRDGAISKEFLHTEEIDFQNLWKEYYKSTTIIERLNLKVHRQHLPKRYWKYLIEKR